MDLEDAKKIMWCEDHEAPDSRPISMLLGLAWFFYEYLPSLQKEQWNHNFWFINLSLPDKIEMNWEFIESEKQLIIFRMSIFCFI